jgi:hypothetical protein
MNGQSGWIVKHTQMRRNHTERKRGGEKEGQNKRHEPINLEYDSNGFQNGTRSQILQLL